jgi:aspartokinase/homoserine dehydrogenase 1
MRNGEIPRYRRFVEALEQRKLQAIDELFPPEQRDEAWAPLKTLCGELLDILHGVELVRECSKRSLDLIMSFGERLNCILVSSYMRSLGMPAEYVDARSCILTDNRHGNAVVDFKLTYQAIKKEIGRRKGIPVVTGFIASTPEGVTTTLGRNGSDYTASLIAAGLGAEAIEIWKDVDGVLSADPDKVKDAFVIDELSYEEAMEMSYFGAEVIHPYTMIPAIEKNIPIWIKNTWNPSVRGTLIASKVKRHGHAISGIASIENIALINVEGRGNAGYSGHSFPGIFRPCRSGNKHHHDLPSLLRTQHLHGSTEGRSGRSRSKIERRTAIGNRRQTDRGYHGDGKSRDHCGDRGEHAGYFRHFGKTLQRSGHPGD